MKKVIYFGYSEKMIKYLLECEFLDLTGAVGVTGRLTEKYYELVKNKNLKYYEISKKQELSSITDNVSAMEIDFIIMYKFEFIIPESMAQKYAIYNFHGGNLRFNRGAHAVVRTILNRDTETCLSLYKLTGGIDEGLLIGEYEVLVDQEDDVPSLNAKLTEGIPYLLKRLELFLNGKLEGELILAGKYWPKISEKDIIIDLNFDTFDVIRGKILSQREFYGAICEINGRKLRVKRYSFENKKSDEKTMITDNDTVILTDASGTMILYCE